jgi:hypothetical protein
MAMRRKNKAQALYRSVGDPWWHRQKKRQRTRAEMSLASKRKNRRRAKGKPT